MKDSTSYDFISLVVAFLGIHEGLVPFVAKLFGWQPFLSLPLRLPAPAWWIVSGAVIAAAMVLLTVLDVAKKRHLGRD